VKKDEPRDLVLRMIGHLASAVHKLDKSQQDAAAAVRAADEAAHKIELALRDLEDLSQLLGNEKPKETENEQ
jgi:hypothetical protein